MWTSLLLQALAGCRYCFVHSLQQLLTYPAHARHAAVSPTIWPARTQQICSPRKFWHSLGWRTISPSSTHRPPSRPAIATWLERQSLWQLSWKQSRRLSWTVQSPHYFPLAPLCSQQPRNHFHFFHSLVSISLQIDDVHRCKNMSHLFRILLAVQRQLLLQLSIRLLNLRPHVVPHLFRKGYRNIVYYSTDTDFWPLELDAASTPSTCISWQAPPPPVDLWILTSPVSGTDRASVGIK